MADEPNPYANEHGVSLFDLFFDAYDRWLEGLPYVGSGSGGKVTAHTQPELIREVWPTVQQLCIRLEAQGKGDLGARVERAFRDAEDYARGIDNYCESEQFDYHLWAYGDPALDTIPLVDAEPEVLLAQAEEIGECKLTEDLYFTAFQREWAAELGKRSAEIEIEKYGHPPTDDYAERTEMRAWACFWLAAQLHRKGRSHQEASGYLEQYLSSHMVVSETKYPVIHEALGRAYGMDIYPIAQMESEEVSAALEGFWTAVAEIRAAVVPAIDVPDVPAKRPSREESVGDTLLSAEVDRAGDVMDTSEQSGLSGQEPIGSQPETDLYDKRVVNWFGKRLYLGDENTQVARLFRLLSKRLGHACPWDEVRNTVFGDATNERPREVEQVKQHVRQVVSKLRDRLAEHGLDDHILIVCEDPKGLPSYSMHVRTKR